MILIQDVMKVETEAKIAESFEEYVKLINVRPVDDTSAEVEKVINVKTGKFSMVSNPLFVKMINQLKMIKLVGLMCVVGWKTKVSLRLVWKFGQPEATFN